MEMPEIIVKSDEQRLGQVDVLCRNDEAEGERAQDEDRDSRQGSDDYRFRIVSRRIVNIHDMHTHHLHSCIEEEDAAGQNQVVEFREIREESLRHVHVVMTSAGDVYYAQNYQESGRNDCSDQSAPLADLADPAEAFHGNEGRYPVDRKDCHQSEYLVRGQGCVRCSVHADVCE